MKLSPNQLGTVGIVDEVLELELALVYGGERQTFGKPLADHQAIALRLAQKSPSLW